MRRATTLLALLIVTAASFGGSESGCRWLRPRDRTWIVYPDSPYTREENGRWCGQQVSVENGQLNITYVWASAVSAFRSLPLPSDPPRLSSLVLKGEVLLMSQPISEISLVVAIGISAKPTISDWVWCGLIPSLVNGDCGATLAESHFGIPCDALSRGRSVAIHADVNPELLWNVSTAQPGWLSVWTGLVGGGASGHNNVTLVFSNLTLEMQTASHAALL